MAEDFYNVASKARRLAQTLEELDITAPEGEWLDITARVASVGVDPRDAAPDYPDKFTLPTVVQISSVGGNCGGLAIAAVAEFRDQDEAARLFNLSIVFEDGGVIFRSGNATNAELIGLILEVQMTTAAVDHDDADWNLRTLHEGWLRSENMGRCKTFSQGEASSTALSRLLERR